MAQDSATPEALAGVVRTMRRDAARRDAMRAALLARARPDAAEALAEAVLACAAAGKRA